MEDDGICSLDKLASHWGRRCLNPGTQEIGALVQSAQMLGVLATGAGSV